MSYTDYAGQARSYRSTAAAATRRAERYASLAAQQYALAGEAAHLARQLTAHPVPGRAGEFFTPVHQENRALTFTRLGDTYLQMSFSSTDSAAFYRELASRYVQMSSEHQAWVTS